jgi:hypothetical protein
MGRATLTRTRCCDRRWSNQTCEIVHSLSFGWGFITLESPNVDRFPISAFCQRASSSANEMRDLGQTTISLHRKVSCPRFPLFPPGSASSRNECFQRRTKRIVYSATFSIARAYYTYTTTTTIRLYSIGKWSSHPVERSRSISLA